VKLARFAFLIPVCHYRVKEMFAYRNSIGLLLIIAVVAVFVSTCVPMPKSLLHSTHAVTAGFLASVHSFGPVLTASLWRHHVSAGPEWLASGTDLINRICSRIC